MRINWFRLDRHPSERDLILALRGQLCGTREERVRRHLADCPECRARSAEMEGTLDRFGELRRGALDSFTAEPEPARADFLAKLDQAAAAPLAAGRVSWQQASQMRPQLMLAFAALALALVAFLMTWVNHIEMNQPNVAAPERAASAPSGGYVWRSWDSASGLFDAYSSQVRAAGGAVWISHGGDYPFSVIEGRQVRQAPRLADADSDFAAGFGDVWIPAADGVYRNSGDEWELIRIPEIAQLSMDQRKHLDLEALDSGRLLILLRDRLLIANAAERHARTILTADEVDSERLLHLACFDRREVWIGTDRGIVRIAKRDLAASVGKRTLYPLPGDVLFNVGWIRPASAGEAFVVASARDGKLTALRFDNGEWEAIRTTNSGSLRIWRGPDRMIWAQDGQDLLSLGPRGDLARFEHRVGGEINDIHHSADGSLWIAASNGLFQGRQAPWREVRDPLVAGETIYAGAAGADEALWFAARRSLLHYDRTGWRTFPLPDGSVTYPLHTNSVTPLVDGSVLVKPRYSRILLQFDPLERKFSKFRHPDGRRFRMIQGRPDGSAWINTTDEDDRFDQRLEVFDGERFTTVLDRGSDWGVGRMKTLYRDSDGALWIGGTHGLGRWSGDSYRFWPGRGHEPSDGVYAIYRDRRGRLLVGSRSGLIEFRDGRWLDVDSSLGKVRSIVEDSSGRLWASGETGVHLESNGVWTTIDENQGLPSKTAWGLVLDRRQRLWVATSSGLARLRETPPDNETSLLARSL